MFGYNGSVGNFTKLTLVTGAPSANGQYNISYSNGQLYFYNNQSIGNGTRPVYSYGGKIQLTGVQNMSNVYHYMQANLSDDFSTTDGSTYTSYVDIILGNSTSNGIINETSDKTLNIEDGYGFSAGSANGTTVNILSDTWNFRWFSNNGTFFRNYTLDSTVQDNTGSKIQNANVTLKDKYGKVVFSLNTSASGTIPQQSVTYALYNYTGNDTFSNSTNKFTLTVTKSPYNDYSQPVDLDRKTTLTITMTLPCTPDLNYTYDVRSGNNSIANRSSTGLNDTLIILIKYGNSLFRMHK